MIKKLLLLGSVLCLFLYTGWIFYSEALIYDPISAVSVKQPGTKDAGKTVSAYSPAWSAEIIEKNLFSPDRGPKPPPRRHRRRHRRRRR